MTPPETRSARRPSLAAIGLNRRSLAQFETLKQGAELIEADGHGEKVLLLPDGHYLKLFRRKRLISSASWYPYAQRFADNARALQARGIPCPEVIEVFRVPEMERDVVHYRPLIGKALNPQNNNACVGNST